MKLFLATYLAASAAASDRPTITETRVAWWNGDEGSNPRQAGPCPELSTPENGAQVIYNEIIGHHRFHSEAVAVCQPGFFPDLTGGKKLKTKCVKKGDQYKWIRTLPKCVTCQNPNPTEQITNGDDGISVYCDYTQRAEHKCDLTCTNDTKLISHPAMKHTSKSKAVLTCKCKKGQCSWTTNKKKNVALDAFECSANRPIRPQIPTECADKEPTCTDVSNKVKKMNSWTCRNCFRIRAYFKFGQFGLKDFDNKDYMDIQFSEQVFHIKHAHPAESFEDIGNNTWRVRFSKQATFSNKEMDFSAEFRSLDVKTAKVVSVKTCPCKDE